MSPTHPFSEKKEAQGREGWFLETRVRDGRIPGVFYYRAGLFQVQALPLQELGRILPQKAAADLFGILSYSLFFIWFIVKGIF